MSSWFLYSVFHYRSRSLGSRPGIARSEVRPWERLSTGFIVLILSRCKLGAHAYLVHWPLLWPGLLVCLSTALCQRTWLSLGKVFDFKFILYNQELIRLWKWKKKTCHVAGMKRLKSCYIVSCRRELRDKGYSQWASNCVPGRHCNVIFNNRHRYSCCLDFIQFITICLAFCTYIKSAVRK